MFCWILIFADPGNPRLIPNYCSGYLLGCVYGVTSD
jgi:hypothetical protein